MKKRAVLLLVIGALVVSACSGGNDTEPTTSERPDDIGDISEEPTTAPVAAPEPTAVPVEVEPAQLSYTSEPGDLLGQVAARFNVPLGALVAANDFENPDLVQIGQVVLIPTDAQVAEWQASEAAATPEDPATEEDPAATDEADG